ncbi:hypothetical protein D0504_09865 [Weissella confusa]|uniref:hypothetical protein n=1 Tax=Weissella confusa TaxID=1583 RepID=UPI0021C0482B|nr:hypothetical protein [Weissella confusa]MCT8393999.1 hypothetical protein [Weissella confusa]
MGFFDFLESAATKSMNNAARSNPEEYRSMLRRLSDKDLLSRWQKEAWHNNSVTTSRKMIEGEIQQRDRLSNAFYNISQSTKIDDRALVKAYKSSGYQALRSFYRAEMDHRGIDESTVSNVSSKDDVADYRVIPAEQKSEYVSNEPTEEERQAAAAAVRRQVELEQEEKRRRAQQRKQDELSQIQNIQKQHYLDTLIELIRKDNNASTDPFTAGVNEFISLVNTFDNYFGSTYKKVLETLPASTSYRQYFGLVFGAYIADKYSNINVNSENSTMAAISMQIIDAWRNLGEGEVDNSDLKLNLMRLGDMAGEFQELQHGINGRLPSAEFGNPYTTTIRSIQLASKDNLDDHLKKVNPNILKTLEETGLITSYLQGNTLSFLENIFAADTYDATIDKYGDVYASFLAVAGTRVSQLLTNDDPSGLNALIKDLKKNKALTRDEKKKLSKGIDAAIELWKAID